MRRAPLAPIDLLCMLFGQRAAEEALAAIGTRMEMDKAFRPDERGRQI
jgi:hypothetical protein